MPGMSGFELYRLIRKQDDKVKVYFVSAIEIDAKEANLVFPDLAQDSFITKPVSIEKIVQFVKI